MPLHRKSSQGQFRLQGATRDSSKSQPPRFPCRARGRESHARHATVPRAALFRRNPALFHGSTTLFQRNATLDRASPGSFFLARGSFSVVLGFAESAPGSFPVKPGFLWRSRRAAGAGMGLSAQSGGSCAYAQATLRGTARLHGEPAGARAD